MNMKKDDTGAYGHVFDHPCVQLARAARKLRVLSACNEREVEVADLDWVFEACKQLFQTASSDREESMKSIEMFACALARVETPSGRLLSADARRALGQFVVTEAFVCKDEPVRSSS
jgi:hypothetical protein